MSQPSPSGFDRFNDALRNLDEQLQELRDRFDENGRRFRSEFRKRADRLDTQLRKSPIYRRADQVRKDLEDQVGRRREQVYDAIGLASKAEIEKLNKKLNTISKKLNELAKEHTADL